MTSFEEIYAILAPVLLRQARYLCRKHPEIMDDFIQSAWIAIFMHCAELRDIKAIKYWGLKVIYSIFCGIIRKAKNSTDKEIDMEGIDTQIDETQTDFVQRKEELRITLGEIARCSEKTRRVIAYHMQGSSFKDISSRMKTPESTAKSRYYKAIRKIRKAHNRRQGKENE